MADSSLNGGNLYVEGGRAWEVDSGIDRTQSEWMGEPRNTEWLKGQDVLGTGEDWQALKGKA